MKLLLDRRESPLFDLLYGGPVEHWRNIQIRDSFLPKLVTPVVFYIGRRLCLAPTSGDTWSSGTVFWMPANYQEHRCPPVTYREEVVETVLRRLRQFGRGGGTTGTSY